MVDSVLAGLYARRQLGVKLGLEAMQALAKALGNPQKNLKFIHIAGTNGKGSVAAMLDSILRYAGFKIGLFTSPHLVSFGERIQIDRVPLSEEKLIEIYKKLQPTIARVEANLNGRQLTFFEITTAMALVAFCEVKVDWVIWETGMGGRLDSTNIVEPQLSVLTSISWDHQQWLGSTLAEIAAEKSGIMKNNIPVICSPQADEIRHVILQHAEKKNAGCKFVDEGKIVLENESLSGQRFIYRGASYELNLLGDHQRVNAATVLEAVNQLRKQEVSISETAVMQGLKKTQWLARFQVLQENPLIILDGAHNEAGIEMLVKNYRALCGEGKTNLLFGVLSDKDLEKIIYHLAPLVKKAALIPLRSSRAVAPETIVRYFAKQQVQTEVFPNFQIAWSMLKLEPLLITGSLYLASDVLWHLSSEL